MKSLKKNHPKKYLLLPKISSTNLTIKYVREIGDKESTANPTNQRSSPTKQACREYQLPRTSSEIIQQREIMVESRSNEKKHEGVCSNRYVASG